MLLSQSFYNRPTLKVAQDLLGCFLVRQFPSPTTAGRGRGRVRVKFLITETEAYNGPYDLASHASRGKTSRNQVMFGEPGIIYVYFTYGMHYMLNIVTEEKDYPAAVLIRAIKYVGTDRDLSLQKTNGPAKLTKILKINKSFNGLPIYTKKYGLWIESRQQNIKPSQIIKAPRVGIDYAGKYKDKKWRFILK